MSNGSNGALVAAAYWAMHQINKENEKNANEEFNHSLNFSVNSLKLMKYCNLNNMAYFIQKVRIKFRRKDYDIKDRYFLKNKRLIREEAENKFGKTKKCQNIAIGVINRKIEQSLITTTEYIVVYKWILGVKNTNII